MIVVGIDQSLAQPGFAALSRGLDGWHVAAAATMRTERGEDVGQGLDDARRVREVFLWLSEQLFMLERGRGGCRVGVEGLVGSKSHRALGAMSQAYALAISVCVSHGLVPAIVSARDAKLAACGNANADKRDVLAAMRRRWEWSPKGDAKQLEAMADALAIASVLAQTVDAEAGA